MVHMVAELVVVMVVVVVMLGMAVITVYSISKYK